MRRLRVDVSKNFSTAASSQEGEFDTSTTTEAPFSTSASPSPVKVLTPVLGAAATASCPCSRSLLTSFDPMSPVPPITTIFIIVSFILDRGISKTIDLLHSLKTEPPAGCPTDRALCDVWILASIGMPRDHNQPRRKNPGPSVEEILPKPQVKWRIQRPHIRKERECVGHPANSISRQSG